MDKQPISSAGFEKLRSRLKQLKEVERPEVLHAIEWARNLGDLSENADYKTAKEAQRSVDSEIRRLEAIADNANVIDIGNLSGDMVMFGATVALEDEDGHVVKYKILSEYESDMSQNIIAVTSPVARAIIGKKVGDVCCVHIPAGEKEYDIMEIKYGAD